MTAGSQSDREHLQRLAAAAAGGDDAAFEGLHRRLLGGLQHLFQRRVGRIEVAEELAQRTWVAVWRSLRAGRYDPARAAISTYVYAVGHHVWLQYCQEYANSGGTEPLWTAAMQPGPDDEPADDLALAELIDAVRACVALEGEPIALTPQERAVVSGLAAGLSERALAGQLGLAPSTIHARKTTAFDKLRRALTQRGFAHDSGERPKDTSE